MKDKAKELGDRLASIKTAEETKKTSEAFDDALKGKDPPSSEMSGTKPPNPTNPPLAAAAE